MELKDKLQKIFNGDYPGNEVFIHDIVRPIFGNEINYVNVNLAEDTEYHEKAEKAGIKHLRYIADIIDQNYNADNIALFDVTLDDRKNIERSRVNIQQLIRSIVQEYSHILIVFHYEDVDEKPWRFSYAYKQDTQANTTPAKRYTYVFGRDFRGRTAAERFEVLAKSERKNSDFVAAFSVEALSDEFFNLYRAYYATFVEYITGEKYTDEKKLNNIVKGWNWRTNDTTNQFATTFDNDAKATRDYIKKMFGRIVFLYFLQRKGWLYNSEGKSDAQYMRHLYEKAELRGLAGRFLDDVLEILFFYILNTKEPEKRIENAELERGKDVRIIPGWDKIPFLNGGLFQDDDIDRSPCVFPASYFRELFTFLDSYNFTIDENDQEDAEVGIDPEMLGRIFENLLEDNKDKGAFYTPKEIVDYMCRESLIAYLQDDKFSQEGKSQIRSFVETLDKQELSDKQRVYLRDKLKAVKICDPAIGSGAFPMGLINLLAKLYISLGVSSEEMAKIKRHIMEKNIYGVDIEQGAVDIARLRFWLAMVVDETEPAPLPNLHFKIMQGNSLLESFKGRDLSGLMTGTGDFFADSEREQLNKLVNDFYNEQSHTERSSKLEQIRKNIRKQIYFLTNDELSDLDPIANEKFFLWHTWFADVFLNGGFDIVIGNPPYLNVERMSDEDKQQYKKLFNSFYKRSDMFALFIELGFNISNTNGIVTMIVPSVVHSNLSYTKLRDIMLNQHWLQEVCYTGGDVFNVPTVDTTILRCCKRGVNEIILKRALEFDNPTISIVDKDFFKPYQNVISIEDSKGSSHLLSKLFNKEFDSFNAHYSVFQGIVTGNNTAFVFDTADEATDKVESVLLHPLCHGRDIERYKTKSTTRRIAYINNAINISDYPLAEKWLNQFRKKLSERREVKRGIIKWYELQWPRVKSELDIAEKVLLQRTRNEALKTRIVATLDNTGVYAMEGVLLILPLDTQSELKFLLGVLNSKLINYLFATKFLNLAIKADYLKQIKLPTPNKKISFLVSQILEIKEKGRQVISYENQIDHIVYHLYNLTYNEVLIVDPETPISREEYESFNLNNLID